MEMNSEWIQIQGSEADILGVLQEQIGLDGCGAARVLAFLEKESSAVLYNDETYQVTKNVPSISPGMLGLMTLHYDYYINIRASTIFLLSVLLDAKVKVPVTAGYLAVKGMNRLIEKIDENSGTKCILMEILRLPGKTGNCEILEAFNGECCNNHLTCRFRSENKYQCTKRDVAYIMEGLADIGILEKRGNFYCYDPIGSL